MAVLSAAVEVAPPTQLKDRVNWLWIRWFGMYGVMASFLLHENQSWKFSANRSPTKLLNYFIISSAATIICGIIDAWLPLWLDLGHHRPRQIHAGDGEF